MMKNGGYSPTILGIQWDIIGDKSSNMKHWECHVSENGVYWYTPKSRLQGVKGWQTADFLGALS
jgi:hypothetical protein